MIFVLVFLNSYPLCSQIGCTLFDLFLFPLFVLIFAMMGKLFSSVAQRGLGFFYWFIYFWLTVNTLSFTDQQLLGDTLPVTQNVFKAADSCGASGVILYQSRVNSHCSLSSFVNVFLSMTSWCPPRSPQSWGDFTSTPARCSSERPLNPREKKTRWDYLSIFQYFGVWVS